MHPYLKLIAASDANLAARGCQSAAGRQRGVGPPLLGRLRGENLVLPLIKGELEGVAAGARTTPPNLPLVRGGIPRRAYAEGPGAGLNSSMPMVAGKTRAISSTVHRPCFSMVFTGSGSLSNATSPPVT